MSTCPQCGLWPLPVVYACECGWQDRHGTWYVKTTVAKKKFEDRCLRIARRQYEEVPTSVGQMTTTGAGSSRTRDVSIVSLSSGGGASSTPTTRGRCRIWWPYSWRRNEMRNKAQVVLKALLHGHRLNLGPLEHVGIVDGRVVCRGRREVRDQNTDGYEVEFRDMGVQFSLDWFLRTCSELDREHLAELEFEMAMKEFQPHQGWRMWETNT